MVVDGNAHLGTYARAAALIALQRPHDVLQHLSSSSATKRGAADYDIGAAALLGLVYAKLDQPKNAEHVLAMIIPAAENSTGLSHMHHAQLHIGATLSLLGRKDEAVRWLTKAADDWLPVVPPLLDRPQSDVIERLSAVRSAFAAIEDRLGTLEKKPLSHALAFSRTRHSRAPTIARRLSSAEWHAQRV